MIFSVLIVAVLLGIAFEASAFSFSSIKRTPPTWLRRMQCNMVNQKDITMPALSSTMKEGKIVSWQKSVGDKVEIGDVLLVVESDKADMDVEAYEEGYLAAIFTPEGESAPVGAAVAALVDSEAEIGQVSTSASAVGATMDSTSSSSANSAPAFATAATAAAASGGNLPEFEQIFMPALSSTMKEGKIVSWSKQEGDAISSGDMVLIVESDKADMDVESYEDGFLAAILVQDGEVAQVGAPVAIIAKSEADIPALQAFAASGGASAVAPSGDTVAPAALAAASPAAAGGGAMIAEGRVAASGYAQKQAKEQGIDLRTVTPSRADKYITSKDLATGAGVAAAAPAASVYIPAEGVISATPMAKKLAKENKLDVTKIVGTGNFGRVTPDDVLRAAGKLAPTPTPTSATATPDKGTSAAAVAPTAATATVLDGVQPMDGMQKAVAKNMERTLTVPIFRVSREIYTDAFDDLYATLKPKGVSVSAMLAKAVAEVLKKHPIINAAYVEGAGGGGIKYNKDINVAMAVAIDGGLITPTIQKCQDLDMFSIARTWRELVDKAKAKKLSPAEYSSGTFTISNLGMFGVQQFDAILPPGTGSILAIAASVPKVVPQKNGFFGVKKAMTVTITCDHRHIYGADAAQFLKDLADLIENNTISLVMS